MVPDAPLPFSIPGPEGRIDAVGLGLNALDHRIVLPGFPIRDARTPILEDFVSVGGQAAIAMATVVRLGGRARYLGTFGSDAAGEAARAGLAGAGVDVSRARRAEGVANQFAVILLQAAGAARTILWRRDPRLAFAPEDVRVEDVGDARVVLVDGHDVEACLEAARLAREAGAPVVLDAEAVLPGTERLVASVDVVLGDAGFAGRLTGESDLAGGLERIRAMGPAIAGATLGADGARVLAGDVAIEEPAFPVEAVDGTGAGDVFHGAFVFGMLQGWSVRRIVRFASACAGLAIERRGGPERIPTLARVLGLVGA